MQWLTKLFKSTTYTSEIDLFLAKLNQIPEYRTPGKVIKEAYYQSLIKKRDPS